MKTTKAELVLVISGAAFMLLSALIVASPLKVFL